MKLGSKRLSLFKSKPFTPSKASEINFQGDQIEPNFQQGSGFSLKDFIINQNQLNTLFKTFLEYNLGPNAPPTKPNSHNRNNQSCLTISNLSTKQRMKHGKEFKEMLDPRDRILEHDFDFSVKIDIEDIKQKGFLNSQTYKAIIDNTQQFMAETLANILSVSFKFLSGSQLQEKEVKNYAAANIMLNLQSIFTQTMGALETSEILKQHCLDFNQIKVDFIEKTETIIKNILINQAAYYPQAPITGGTLRMNSAIHEVNRVDDQENDLIFSNGIKISKYLEIQVKDGEEKLDLKQDKDYTEFIMEVVNTAIKVVQTCEGDSQQRVNKQIFTEFNKQMFALSQIQSFKELFYISEDNSYNLERNEEEISTERKKEFQTQKQKKTQKAKQAVSSYFQRITETDAQKLKKVQKAIQTNELCHSVNKQREKSLEHLKDYGIGFKIPNYVKPFSRQQIAEKQFRAKHSSVLRIMTKWAEYLQDIFINAEKHIMMRRYPFKDIDNKVVNTTGQFVKQYIAYRLNREYVEVNRKLEQIKYRNIELMSQIFSKSNRSLPHNVYRFTQTRQVSTKINALLTSLIIEYISVLIHHLLKAGANTKQYHKKYGIQFAGHINLVVFRVSDLMRAKFKCSETSFITLLKTMHLLDQSPAMKGKFKLVRIKNKLEDPANNIMVNYLFMGKVLCQLQLSIQESKGKEKNYYIFSHFIYELTRGNFGVISYCAIIVSQLDPIASSCNQLYYEQKHEKYKEKKQKKQKKEKKEQQMDQNSQGQPQEKQKIKKDVSIFYCAKCEKFIIDEETKLFQKVQGVNKCLKCLFTEKEAQVKINKEIFPQKQFILQKLSQGRIIRVTNYYQEIGKHSSQNLADHQTQTSYGILQPFLRLSSGGKLQFLVIVYLKSQLKHFLLKLGVESLRRGSQKQKIDFGKGADYINIQNQMKKKKQIKDYFIFRIIDKETLEQILKRIQTSYHIYSQQLSQLIKAFFQFRIEKKLIKAIKSKAEILSFSQAKQQWRFFHRLWQIYSIGDNADKQSRIDKEIIYTSFKFYQQNVQIELQFGNRLC